MAAPAKTEAPLRPGAWVAPRIGAQTWDAAELNALLSVAPVRRYAKGEHIYHHGDPAQGFYVVLEGRIKLSSPTVGGERLVALCGAGDLFGVSRCAGMRAQALEAVCQSHEARLIAVDCHVLKAVLQAQPLIGARLVSVLSSRIETLEEQLEHNRLPVQARLARTLLALAHRLGTQVEPGVFETKLELRHDEIASLAGTGRVSVTQAFSAWRAMGLVSGTRGSYRVNVARLVALCELLEAQALG